MPGHLGKKIVVRLEQIDRERRITARMNAQLSEKNYCIVRNEKLLSETKRCEAEAVQNGEHLRICIKGFSSDQRH